MDDIPYKKQLRMARAVLVLAFVVAIPTWFLRLDITDTGLYRTGRTVLWEAAYGWTKESAFWTIRNLHLGFNVQFRFYLGMLELLLAITLVGAPVFANFLARSNSLRGLWILLDLTLGYALVLYCELGHDGFYTDSTTISVDPGHHQDFLPGFYLACLATLLHFAGLILIPSARSLDPTVPPA